MLRNRGNAKLTAHNQLKDDEKCNIWKDDAVEKQISKSFLFEIYYYAMFQFRWKFHTR